MGQKEGQRLLRSTAKIYECRVGGGGAIDGDGTAEYGEGDADGAGLEMHERMKMAEVAYIAKVVLAMDVDMVEKWWR